MIFIIISITNELNRRYQSRRQLYTLSSIQCHNFFKVPQLLYEKLVTPKQSPFGVRRTRTEG